MPGLDRPGSLHEGLHCRRRHRHKRKSYDSLAAIVANVLALDPFSGHLLIFSNRGRNRLKILLWESSGFWIFSKRLEAGTFAWPRGDGGSLELTYAQLTLLLGGIDLEHTAKRRWFDRPMARSERLIRSWFSP